MAFVAYLMIFLAMAGHSTAQYCLCKAGVNQSIQQTAIDFACGSGADCTQILQNGACYNPNTVQDHCNYAANSYFQRKGQIAGSCDFSGAAMTNPNPPSNVASGCVYPSSGSIGTGTTTPTMTPTGTSTGFGGTLGPTGTTGINDSSGGGGGVALFKLSNLVFYLASMTLWFHA